MRIFVLTYTRANRKRAITTDFTSVHHVSHRQLELMQQLSDVIALCQKTRVPLRLSGADLQKIVEQSQRPAIGASLADRWPTKNDEATSRVTARVFRANNFSTQERTDAHDD